MSWGYGTTRNNLTALTYRGSSINLGPLGVFQIANLYGFLFNTTTGGYISNIRVGAVDVDIEEMISAGIIVCIAAGNRSHKIDTSTGLDYNNSAVVDGTTFYYHRGSSPYSENALIVGSMDSTTNSITLDKKASYSETGPGVTMWSPGTDIMSSTSNTNRFSGQSYYLNASYKQCNISGTSMAAPQVAGVAALVMQLYPSYTPAQLKASLLSTATADLYTTVNNSTDYDDNTSLLGSAKKILYSNYVAPTTTTTTSTTTASPTTTTTSTTAAPTTTTTTTAAPISCTTYKCSANRGGYLYWTDCQTGAPAYSLLNGSRTKFISSRSYPTQETGAKITSDEVSVYYL
jgi:subtilisin family serine protease